MNLTIARLARATLMAVPIAIIRMTIAPAAAGQISADGRATTLLEQARRALGGEARLAGIGGLSCAGSYSRQLQDRQLTGDLTIDLQLPDKMLRTETMNPIGDTTITIEQGFNGETVLRHSASSGGGPGMMFRTGGSNTPEAQAQMLKSLKADAARLTLGLLLTASSAMPLDVSYAGEADGGDGHMADVIDAKGAGSFAARLFLDKTNHRPLMLTYRGIAPRVVISTEHRDGHDPRMNQTLEKAVDQKMAAAAERTLQTADIAVYFDEYKQVDGIWLPHRISRSIDGQPNEEWTFKTIKVNPAFKPATFEPR